MTIIIATLANGNLGTMECDVSIAPVVELLEDVFEKFNKYFFESALSKPVITLSQKGTKNALGWCSRKKIWED